MRRFSQRNHLVTLSDINITPLLDLAFVLLIIFVITTPLLEKGLELNLPTGGREETRLEKKDFKTVEVSPAGDYMLDRQKMPIDRIEQELIRAHRANPNLVVRIRADASSLHRHFTALVDRCQRHGITRFSIRTHPEKP